MIKMVQNHNKYEGYIRVGHTGVQNPDGSYTCSDLQDFPTPSTLTPSLYDLDKDPFTDLEGYTHRNRVRHDICGYDVGYNVASDDDLAYLLTRIGPEWIYVETIDKHSRADVKDNNNYVKYISKNGGETYWYDTQNLKLYDKNYVEITTFNLNNFTKITSPIKIVHKMYASDKSFDTTFVWIDEDNHWHEEQQAFSFSLVEE